MSAAGSEICLHEVASGETRVLLACEGVVEAPNWHPDGYLIVNGDGRLWRVDLEAPALVPIPTGRVGGLNNDHGLSPDARRLAISGKSEGGGERGASCIYLVAVEGGEPVRVTERVPSWWHGWLPARDGGEERLLYVGARDGGPILPYSCRLDGSDERRLAEGFDHVDGPDATPDGEWVWFNGERGGRVDLWRVRPDGSGLERMTGGDSVDWFPHPSPDGRLVLWLAYPPGTEGHPAMREVALRLMPAEGGEGREAVRLLGGQGTINVPCWSPDGAAFAFVRYRA